MSKSSVATVRETPVGKTTAASAGGLAVIAETIDVETSERIEIIDLTDTVMAFVRRSGVREGLLSLCSMHTTCTVFINESQAALESDILAFLEGKVAGWWLPDDVVFVDELPHTATGKVMKSRLRETFKDHPLPTV